jgi:hypothetical protein
MKSSEIRHGHTYRSRANSWDLFVLYRSGEQMQYEVKTGPLAGKRCACSVIDFAERVTREVPNHIVTSSQ